MVPFAMEKSRYQAGNANGFRPTPYSFQHHLDLTDDVDEFKDLIEKIDKVDVNVAKKVRQGDCGIT